MRPYSAIAAAVLVFGSECVGAQEQTVTWRSTAKTAVFVELFGNGGLLTYNVDRKLNQHVTARFAYGDFASIEFGDGVTKHYQTFTGMVNGLVGGPLLFWELGAGAMVGSY